LGDTDLLRALDLAHVPSAVCVAPGEPSRHSRLARVALPWADPWTQPDTLVGILERFAAPLPEPPVLFYDEDRYVLLLSRERERLRRHCRFVVPTGALVEDLVDKSRFQLLAERLGLPIPPGAFVDPCRDPAPLDFGFPVAIKPRQRDEHWPAIGGEAKALRVDSPRALRELWPRLAAARMPVLVQQLIRGSESQVESYHVYVDERGDIAGEFTGRKLRTWPAEYGFSTALVTSDAPDVVVLGRDIVARLELRGVAKLDFKRAPDGRLHLLEVNPRFNLWHHVGARAGVNIPALVYADLVGETRPRPAVARAGVRWCKPWHDLLAARKARVPWFSWVTWTLGAEAKRTLAWDDPFPLIGAFLERRISRLRHRLPEPATETP
jgi:predicted ATP-grasp superfamily ATP-dependent carboligase